MTTATREPTPSLDRLLGQPGNPELKKAFSIERANRKELLMLGRSGDVEQVKQHLEKILNEKIENFIKLDIAEDTNEFKMLQQLLHTSRTYREIIAAAGRRITMEIDPNSLRCVIYFHPNAP